MNRPTVGIVGAGRAGTAIARCAITAGYTVYVSNSRGPQSLRLTVDVLMRGATAVTASEAAARGDIVILALPLRRYRTLSKENMEGKIVIDAMNYVPAEDGIMAELENGTVSSSELVQSFLPGARLVKTLNHISYQEMEEEARPGGTESRRALALAGNDHEAKALVAGFLSDLGFDSVDVGPLSEGRRFEPGTPIFTSRFSAAEITSAAKSR